MSDDLSNNKESSSAKNLLEVEALVESNSMNEVELKPNISIGYTKDSKDLDLNIKLSADKDDLSLKVSIKKEW